MPRQAAPFMRRDVARRDKEDGHRRRVDGQTKREVKDRLEDIERGLGAGVKASATYAVEQAVANWLDNQGNLAAKTIQTKHELLAPILAQIGRAVLRDLEADLVVSLTTGIRTEEARALRWERVDLCGDPPHTDVFRSVRAHG